MRFGPLQRQESETSDDTVANLKMRRNLLILIGVAVGLAVSLYYAWLVEPVTYVKASPARFDASSQEEYIFLVSQSYAANGDWSLARQRLAALDVPDINERVEQQLEKNLRNGETAHVMQNLATLAKQLGVYSVAVDIFAPDVVETSTPSPTSEPTPLRTRVPTRTPIPAHTPTSEPTAIPLSKFRLFRQEQVCHPEFPVRRLEVIVVDSSLDPVPGAEVIVQWNEGVDHFFTGFHPEKGLGYGDFAMEPDIVYRVQLAEGSPLIDDLKIGPCGEAQGGLAGGWRLTFQDTGQSDE